MRLVKALHIGAIVGMASLLGASLNTPLNAQNRSVGEWHGVLTTPGGKLALLFTFSHSDGGGRVGDMVSLDQTASPKLVLSNVTETATRLAFNIPSIGATYEGEWKDADQTWAGVFRQGMALPLVLKRGAPPATKVVEGLDGKWRASLQRGTATLRLILNVQTTARGTRVTLDSPDLSAIGLEVEQFEREGNAVRFRVPSSDVQFAGTLGERSSAFSGSWLRVGQPAAQVTFTRDTAASAARVRTQWPITPKGYRAQEVSFANPADKRVTLAGTLTIPDRPGRHPAVVLISGSGPQDRDESVFGHKPFAVLADYLTRQGIAVLRYDDRGFAKSTGDHTSATSADFATDANAALRYLLGRSEIDHKAIGLIGHSEGGMIGPLAAVDNKDVAFLVLLAGPGTRTDQVLVSQRRLMGLAQGVTNEDLDRSEPAVRNLFAAVRDAADSSSAYTRVRALLTAETLAALGASSGSRDALADQYTTPWMRYFLKYEPSVNLSRIRVPVLAINGSLDVQVASAENLAAIRAALAKNPDATVVELPGLNHLFQTARTGAMGEYDGIAETFAPSAMEVVANWIVRRFRNP